MEKEILTKGRIKADLQRFVARKIMYCIFLFVFFAVFCLFIKIFFEEGSKVLLFFPFVFCVACVLSLIRNITNIIWGIYQGKNNKFVIKNDFVTNKLYKKIGGRHIVGRPYTLIFAHNGRYGIHSGIHYKWSKLYSMKGSEVYESTTLNDEFYVIAIKKEVAVAYNKRYFELDK